jgi:hypothetical protein
MISIERIATLGRNQRRRRKKSEMATAIERMMAGSFALKIVAPRSRNERELAVVLTETIRNNASIDWEIKENVRAKMHLSAMKK